MHLRRGSGIVFLHSGGGQIGLARGWAGTRGWMGWRMGNAMVLGLHQRCSLSRLASRSYSPTSSLSVAEQCQWNILLLVSQSHHHGPDVPICQFVIRSPCTIQSRRQSIRGWRDDLDQWPRHQSMDADGVWGEGGDDGRRSRNISFPLFSHTFYLFQRVCEWPSIGLSVIEP